MLNPQQGYGRTNKSAFQHPKWWVAMMINFSDGRIVRRGICRSLLTRYHFRVLINRKRQMRRWQASRHWQRRTAKESPCVLWMYAGGTGKKHQNRRWSSAKSKANAFDHFKYLIWPVNDEPQIIFQTGHKGNGWFFMTFCQFPLSYSSIHIDTAQKNA